jgi:putative Mg2+ transporter-C (MgtC) family protein
MVVHLSDLMIFGHISLAALLGFILGFERQLRGHVAGGRTFSVVATASAAITALGVNDFPASAEKVIAGIITGIGFLGAGLVLHTGAARPKGLTTAAAVWAVSAVGIVVGIGHLLLGVAITGLLIFVLEVRYLPGLGWLDPDWGSARFKHDPDDEPPPTEATGETQPPR